MAFMDRLVLAIRQDLKTETRRVLPPKLQEELAVYDCRDQENVGDLVVGYAAAPADGHSGVGWYGWCGSYPDEGSVFIGRRYAVGDLFWVQENHRILRRAGDHIRIRYSADGRERVVKLTDREAELLAARSRLTGDQLVPARFMYRSCARELLELTRVRIARLQSITEEEAQAEGVILDGNWWLGPAHPVKGTPKVFPSARAALAALWDSVNGHRQSATWAADPWSWALTFQRVGIARRAA